MPEHTAIEELRALAAQLRVRGEQRDTEADPDLDPCDECAQSESDCHTVAAVATWHRAARMLDKRAAELAPATDEDYALMHDCGHPHCVSLDQITECASRCRQGLRPADTGTEAPSRVPHPAGRTPTDAEVRAGRIWAVWSAAHATTPQSHSAARYTLSRIPGGVLVRWDGTRWVALADTGKETDR